MKEIRLHGRGGQGAAMASDMLSAAFVKEGKYAANFPMFGFERRGMPVTAFLRFDDRPIREKTQIYAPDCLIIFDPGLWRQPPVYAGLKDDGIMVLNYHTQVKEPPNENIGTIGIVDATGIALQEIGAPITNTCVMGAFAATTGWLGLDSLLLSLEEHFEGAILDKNRRCMERGFKEVQVENFRR
jgi:2-oxoacid:acceptor oxidoreductase gamma subunit (pyruvate/2-ketoisovalerate family)